MSVLDDMRKAKGGESKMQTTIRAHDVKATLERSLKRNAVCEENVRDLNAAREAFDELEAKGPVGHDDWVNAMLARASMEERAADGCIAYLVKVGVVTHSGEPWTSRTKRKYERVKRVQGPPRSSSKRS